MADDLDDAAASDTATDTSSSEVVDLAERRASRPATPPDPAELTARQRMVLDCLIELLRDKGYAPTTRELCGALGVRSTNGVHEHLLVLERKGWLARASGTSRSLRLLYHPGTGARWSRVDDGDPVEPEPDARDTEASAAPGKRAAPSAVGGCSVAVLGKVAAGVPIPAVEVADEVLIVDPRLARDPGTFALRVEGRSMIDAGILPADLVLVRPRARVDNGRIAVVDLDGEVTVKRLYQEPQGVRLVAENREMAPIVLDRAAGARLRIIGEVCGVVRTLH